MGQTISSTFGSSPAETAPNFGPELKRPHPDDVNDAAMPAPKTTKAHAHAVAGSSQKPASAGARGSGTRSQGRFANCNAPPSAMALVTPSTCSGSTAKSTASSSATSTASLNSVQHAATAPSPVARIATLFGLGPSMGSLATPAAAVSTAGSSTSTSTAHSSSAEVQKANAVSGGGSTAADADNDNDDDENDDEEHFEDALGEQQEDSEGAPQSPPWATLADCAADSFASEGTAEEGTTTATAAAAGKSPPNAEKNAREEYREGQVVWAWARLPSDDKSRSSSRSGSNKKHRSSSYKVEGVWWPALIAHKKATMQRFLGMKCKPNLPELSQEQVSAGYVHVYYFLPVEAHPAVGLFDRHGTLRAKELRPFYAPSISSSSSSSSSATPGAASAATVAPASGKGSSGGGQEGCGDAEKEEEEEDDDEDAALKQETEQKAARAQKRFRNQPLPRGIDRQFLEVSEREAVLLLQGRCSSSTGGGGAGSSSPAKEGTAARTTTTATTTTTTRQGAAHAALLAANVIPISPLATPAGTPLSQPMEAPNLLSHYTNAGHANSASSFHLDAEVDEDEDEGHGGGGGAGMKASPSKTKKAKKQEVVKQYQGRRNRPPAVHMTPAADDGAAADEEEDSAYDEVSDNNEMGHVEYEEEEEEYFGWHFLKQRCGWTNRRNPHHDFVYLRPGQLTYDAHRESPDNSYFFTVQEALDFAKAWGVVSRNKMPAPLVKGGEIRYGHINEAPPPEREFLLSEPSGTQSSLLASSGKRSRKERSKKQPFKFQAANTDDNAGTAQGSAFDDDDDDVIDLDELTFTTLRSEFGWKWKNAPLISGDTWHLFRPGVDKNASAMHSECAHTEKNLHWFSDDKLAVVFAQSWRVGQRYNGGKQIRCGHVDEPPPEGWQLPAILSASATNMSMRGVADVSSESDAEVSSDDDDDESIEVSDDDDDEEVMSETEEENDEKFHVNPEDITYRELRTYGWTHANSSSLQHTHFYMRPSVKKSGKNTFELLSGEPAVLNEHYFEHEAIMCSWASAHGVNGSTHFGKLDEVKRDGITYAQYKEQRSVAKAARAERIREQSAQKAAALAAKKQERKIVRKAEKKAAKKAARKASKRQKTVMSDRQRQLQLKTDQASTQQNEAIKSREEEMQKKKAQGKAARLALQSKANKEREIKMKEKAAKKAQEAAAREAAKKEADRKAKAEAKAHEEEEKQKRKELLEKKREMKRLEEVAKMKKREHDLAVAKRKKEKADKAAAAAVQQAAIAAAKEKVRNALSSRQAEKALRDLKDDPDAIAAVLQSPSAGSQRMAEVTAAITTTPSKEWDLKHLFQYLQTKGWAYRAAPSTDLATNWYVVSPEWAQAKNLRGAILGQDYFREMSDVASFARRNNLYNPDAFGEDDEEDDADSEDDTLLALQSKMRKQGQSKKTKRGAASSSSSSSSVAATSGSTKQGRQRSGRGVATNDSPWSNWKFTEVWQVLQTDHNWSWQVGKGLVARYYLRAGAVYPACLEHASTSAHGGKGLNYEYFESEEAVMAYAYAHQLYTPQEEVDDQEVEGESEQEVEEEKGDHVEIESKKKSKQDGTTKKGAVIEETHEDDSDDEIASDNEVMMSQMAAAEAEAEWEKSKAALAQDDEDEEDEDGYAPPEWQWSDVWAHLNYLGWTVTQRDANGNRVYSPRDGSAKLRSVQKVKEYAYAKGIYPPVPESDDSSSESEEEEIDEDDEDDEISDNEEEENSMEETTEASFAPQQQEVKEGETSIASTSTVPAPGPSLQAVLAKEAMAPGAKAMPAAGADHHPGRGHRPERRAAAASAAESIVGSGSGNSSSCNTASTTAQPFSPDLVSFRALPSLSKKHAPNNNGSAKSGVSQSQPEMGGVSDPLTCDWHGLWQGLMKMGWQKVPVQGYTLPASDLAPAICVGKTEVDVREWLSDGREMLVADWALLWAHLEKIGWKRQTQKGIAHCSSVYCVPGGSGGGPENVEWFRTSFLVRKRLHAYPELLLDWGQMWLCLRANGWHHKDGKGLSSFKYCPPGSDSSSSSSGSLNEVEAHQFVCRHPDLLRTVDDYNEEINQEVSGVPVSVELAMANYEAKSNARDEEDDDEEGEDDAHKDGDIGTVETAHMGGTTCADDDDEDDDDEDEDDEDTSGWLEYSQAAPKPKKKKVKKGGLAEAKAKKALLVAREEAARAAAAAGTATGEANGEVEQQTNMSLVDDDDKVEDDRQGERQVHDVVEDALVFSQLAPVSPLRPAATTTLPHLGSGMASPLLLNQAEDDDKDEKNNASNQQNTATVAPLVGTSTKNNDHDGQVVGLFQAPPETAPRNRSANSFTANGTLLESKHSQPAHSATSSHVSSVHGGASSSRLSVAATPLVIDKPLLAGIDTVQHAMASFTNDDDDKFTHPAAEEDFVSNFGDFDVFSPDDGREAVVPPANNVPVPATAATAVEASATTAKTSKTNAANATNTTTTTAAAANAAVDAADADSTSATTVGTTSATSTTAVPPQSVAPTHPAISSVNQACRIESALPSAFTAPPKRHKFRGSTMPVARLSLSGALVDHPSSGEEGVDDEREEADKRQGGEKAVGAAGLSKKAPIPAAPAPATAAVSTTAAAAASVAREMSATSATTAATTATVTTATVATANVAKATNGAGAALNLASKSTAGAAARAGAAAAAAPKPEPLTLSEASAVLEAATKALHPNFTVTPQEEQTGAAAVVMPDNGNNNCGRAEDVAFISTFIASHLQGDLCDTYGETTGAAAATAASVDSAAARARPVDALSGGYSSLWLCGRPGTGKTHTVAESIRKLLARTPSPSSTSTSSTSSSERGGGGGGEGNRGKSSRTQPPPPAAAAAAVVVPEFVPVCLNASSFVSDPQAIYLELHKVLSASGSGLLLPKKPRHYLDDSDDEEDARKCKSETMTFKKARYELDCHFNALCDRNIANQPDSDLPSFMRGRGGGASNKKKRKGNASPEVPAALPCVLVMDELDHLWRGNPKGNSIGLQVALQLFIWASMLNHREADEHIGAPLVLLAVTNSVEINPRFKELLSQNDVYPPEAPERLRVFKPYNATILKNIVTARVGPHLIHDSALTLLQRKVEANSGDARRSLDLVRHAVSVAADELAVMEQQEEKEGAKTTLAAAAASLSSSSASSSSSSSSRSKSNSSRSAEEASSGLQQPLKQHAFPLVTMAHVKKSIELHAKGNGSSDRAAPALSLPLMAQVLLFAAASLTANNSQEAEARVPVSRKMLAKKFRFFCDKLHMGADSDNSNVCEQLEGQLREASLLRVVPSAHSGSGAKKKNKLLSGGGGDSSNLIESVPSFHEVKSAFQGHTNANFIATLGV